MQMSDIPFGVTDWSQIERTEHQGDSGMAYWRTQKFSAVHVRMVDRTQGRHELSGGRQGRTAPLVHGDRRDAFHRRLKRRHGA
jgi:hypothetical protein